MKDIELTSIEMDNIHNKRRIAYLYKKVKLLTNKLENVTKILSNFQDYEIAKENVEKLDSDQEERLFNICSIFCKYKKINLKVLLQSKNQSNEFVFNRQIAHYLVKKYCKLSLSTIGEKIGDKTHATILHSDKTIKDYLTYNKNLQRDIYNLEVEIENQLKLKFVSGIWNDAK